MKSIARFFVFILCAVPFGAGAAPVATTAGSNLTAYSPGGVSNNNMWNAMMSGRGGEGAAAPADFGNCNALIMRCASPKCAGGGCSDMSVAASIVSGCVNSNSACKKYGDDLINFMSAQLVASSNAKINEANAAAQNAAAQAAAQQSAQQMAAMQQQMQQMQAEMAQQNAQQIAAMQAALDEQKQLTADAMAQANAARESAPVADNTSTTTDNGLTVAQQIAAQNGVSADILAREQITGQIMSKLENAETALKALKTTMQDAFDYAGCDSFGNNCSGPKRVSAFKSRAIKFFDPYNTVLDELYDALISAQAAGVDITDIYMMLEGSCNVWGQYLCSKADLGKYDTNNCIAGKSKPVGSVKGGRDCVENQPIPPEDSKLCVLQKTYSDGEQVRRAWLYPDDESETDGAGAIRVGCASSALDNSAFFRNRKKQAKIDIETLERIIEQDASSSMGLSLSGRTNRDMQRANALMACAVGEGMYSDLQKITATKKLPKQICMKQTAALNKVQSDTVLTLGGDTNIANILTCRAEAEEYVSTGSPKYEGGYNECICKGASGTWKDNKCTCSNNNVWIQSIADCVNAEQYCKDKIECKASPNTTASWSVNDNKCVCQAGGGKENSNVAGNTVSAAGTTVGTNNFTPSIGIQGMPSFRSQLPNKGKLKL